MTILEEIKAYLETAMQNNSVAIAGSAAGTLLMTAKQNGQALYGHLGPIFGNVSPLHGEQDSPLPEALYRLSSTGATEWGGFEVTHVSSFEVSARCATYKELLEKVDALDVALKGVAGFEAVDSAEAYDDLRTAYRADIAIDICRPLADIVLVELAQEVEGTGFIGKNCTQYDYATTYGLIHHASTYAEMNALRTDTRQVMRSFVSADGDRLDAGSGEALQAAGGLIGWTDLYSFSTTE